MRKLAILALFALCIPGVSAQRTGSGFAHFSHPMPAHGSAGSLTSRPEFAALRNFDRNGRHSDFLSSFGLLSDLYAGDSSGYPAPPNFLFMPPPPSPGISEGQPSQAAQPLMIELQGGRYVRVKDGDENSDRNASAADYSSAENFAKGVVGSKHVGPTSPALGAGSSIPAKPTPAGELLPTVLVFRDGHTESVRDYAIADGVIYARGNYYVDGYWNKKIEVSALNVPQTVQSNEARGVQFLLPGAPNEVITRP